MNTRIFGTIAWLTIAAAAGVLVAADQAGWPQWLGPRRCGVAPEGISLIEKLPEKPEPIWQIQVGEGKPESHASPVCEGNLAILHANLEKREKREDGKTRKYSVESLICVAVDSGKELWRKEYRGESNNTPVMRDGKVYFVNGDGEMLCLKTADGSEVWKCKVNKRRGTNSSPVLAADVVAVVVGRDLVAVDREKGTKRWAKRVKVWNNSPAVWTHNGTDYLIAGNREVVCLAAEDGKQLWTMEGTKLEKDPASPAICGDRMAILWEGMGLVVYELSADGAKKIAEASEFVPQTGGAHQATSPGFDGEIVVGVDKEKTFCFRVKTGKLLWKGDKGDTHASPILVDGKALVRGKRSLMMFDLADGEKLGEAKIDAAGCSSLALAGNKLLVNAGRTFQCYDLGRKK